MYLDYNNCLLKLELNADVFRNAIKYFLCKKLKKNAILVRVSRIKFKTGWDKIYIFSRPGMCIV